MTHQGKDLEQPVRLRLLRLPGPALWHPIECRQMNRLAILVLALGVGAPATFSQNLSAPTSLKMGQTGANTFVGVISDSSCGPRHKMMDKSAQECTRACQRAGARYVLVAGEKIYNLQGRANDIAYLAGQKAKITGSLQGNRITVNDVAVIK